jgi:NAD(P)-dependent dehydrogenase (short-subunit alcohol dehydrogenase family)
MRLQGKIAVVTGGGRGIGRAIVDRFSTEGAHVTVVDRDEPAEEMSDGQLFRQGDVADPSVWEAVVRETLAAHERIDVLVNNAGIIDYAALHEVDLETWDRSVAVNQTAVMLGMRAVIPGMLATGSGAIVNISSIWGNVAVGGAASYHATKAAVRNLSKNAAVTYATQGIRVNSIHPGIISTPLVTAQDADVSAWVVSQTPMGRMGSPQGHRQRGAVPRERRGQLRDGGRTGHRRGLHSPMTTLTGGASTAPPHGASSVDHIWLDDLNTDAVAGQVAHPSTTEASR